MRQFLAACCLVLGLAGCAEDHASVASGPLPQGCALTLRAEVPLRNQRNFMLAPVAINGQMVTMVVDTGAEVTTLTPAAAARLGLPAVGGSAGTRLLHGIAGEIRSNSLRVHELALNGHVLRRDMQVDVGALPAFPGISPPVAGLLGDDVLAGFDLDLDLPAHRLALYNAVGCAGFVPWPGAVTVLLRRSRSGLAMLDGVVNGRRVATLLDSGARTTLLRQDVALNVGVTQAELAADRRLVGVGVGSGRVTFHLHRFAELGVPGDVERDMAADIGDFHLSGVEMLLGADYLGQRRVWMSLGSGRLFLRR